MIIRDNPVFQLNTKFIFLNRQCDIHHSVLKAYLNLCVRAQFDFFG